MTPRELYLLALDRSTDGGWLSDTPPSIALVIPRPMNARFGDRVFIAGRGSPLGRVMTVKENEAGTGLDVNVRVECKKVMDWLDSNGYSAEIRNEL